MARILCIGGPGTLSSSALADWAARGDDVTLFTHTQRGLETLPPGVKVVAGDRNDAAALKAAVKRARPEIVVDFICFQPQQAQAIATLLAGRVAQYLFVSTVDAYGFPLTFLPQHEDDACSPPHSPYAANKRACEELLAAVPNLPLTIARPTYSFGPRFVLSFMARDQGVHLLARLRAGKPVLVPGDGTTLIHASSADDVGRMIAHLAGAPRAIGQDYTVGTPGFMTHESYVHMWSAALGVALGEDLPPPQCVHIPSDFILSLDRPELRDCLLRELSSFNVAFSIEKFRSHFPEFAWQWSPVTWALQTARVLLDQGKIPSANERIFDDELIETWERAMRQLRARLSADAKGATA